MADTRTPQIEQCDVLDLLTSLFDKSLVSREENTSAPGRYRLSETLREYAWERLERGALNSD